ncbi:MAG TPA: AAA family ATPase [Ensifer sp.]|jgi:class 3 adenylate cyclase/tetratricopeptide (TPR) repeat protein|uniref:AAA family ATPase n=1 Tax=Ensifer sp. TaxID=1872086 RepID=UPI002E1517F5|nr:AAA family ATPase [Ensifer sp.]
MNVADWLRAIGMVDYVDAFEANHIDVSQLAELTDADLKEIGVSALGDRRAILKAAACGGSPATGSNAQPDFEAYMAAERRHLTILFLDIVDSTALSTATDPETLSLTIAQFHRVAASKIRWLEGYVAQSFGDGLMAYFGWPQAHEDDAQRAVVAAEAVHEALRELRDPIGKNLRARAGIATGWVVLGNISGVSQIEVVGEAPNLAARLQTVASPGHTVVSSAAAELLGDDFVLLDLGPQTLKGFSSPPRAYQVLEIQQKARFQPRTSGHMSPFVGREEETALLWSAWHKARNGQGQVVVLDGEAGIGKTRIIRELTDRIHADPHIGMRYQCSPYYQTSALRPLIEQLSEAAGFHASDDDEKKALKLGSLLKVTDASSEAVALLAELLAVPLSGDVGMVPTTPAEKRDRLFSALLEQFTQLARRIPVFAIVEDAHWIDPTTADYLDLIAHSVERESVLLVITGRPDYVFPQAWLQLPNVHHCTIRGLEEDDARDLADRVAGGALPAMVSDEIVSRTDGVPLFVEELAKTLVESGCVRLVGTAYEAVGALPESEIPASLQDSLTARLDRLPNAKAIAQTAAALGREFRLDHLSLVSMLPPRLVRQALYQLEAAGLVFERSTNEDQRYVFKHSLIQKAAYESMLLAARRQLHGRIADIVISKFPDQAESEPEVVAAHLAMSDEPQKSAPYWLAAGRSSLRRSAYPEAVSQLREGKKRIASSKNDPETLRLEFELCLCLGQASYVASGPAAADTISAYSRALELIDTVGASQQRFDLTYGIFSGYHFASKFGLAREPAIKMMEMAVKDDDAGQMCQAHRMLGYLSFFDGNLADALKHFEALDRMYDPDQHAQMATRYGADCLVASRAFRAVAVGARGEVKFATSLTDKNLAYGRHLNHPPTLGWAYAAACFLNYFLGDPERVLDLARDGREYCTEHAVPVWGLHCKIFETWATAVLKGAALVNVEDLRETVANARSRTSLGLPLFRSVLAEVSALNGEVEAAREESGAALRDLETTAQHFFAPSVHLVRATCLRQLGQRYLLECEAQIGLSVETARKMGARLLELRAHAASAAAGCSSSAPAAKVRELCCEMPDRNELDRLRAAWSLLLEAQGKTRPRSSAASHPD